MVQWRRGRRSSNVEDRRGTRVRKGAVGGGVGLLIMILVAWLLGADPGQILQLLGESSQTASSEEYQPTPEENRTAEFVSAMLADTEDTWSTLFAEQGQEYREPTLVLFTGATESACGFAGAAVGPFYCPRDEQIYIDLSFFQDLADRFGAPGDFGRAYVLAHEVGHHVQTLWGIGAQVRDAQERAPSRARANELQVRMELQADCLAGIWAHYANRNRGSGEIRLEPGDVEEGLRAAAAIGDDRLQRRSQGYVVPESFTHGTSAQRAEWLRRGMQEGTLAACDTSGG